MSQPPTRLVDEDPDFARLVEASRHHEPSSKGFDETLSLVTRAAGDPRTTEDRDEPARSSLRSSMTHVIAGAALVGAIGFGVARIWTAPPPPSTGAATAAGTMSDEAPHVNAPEAPVPTLPVKALAEAPAEATSPRSGSGQAPSGSVAATPRTDDPAAAPKRARPARDLASPAGSAARASFSEELALVSAARSALEANDFASCLRTADRYDERFGSGILRQEIEVLRITALFGSGERTRGEALARGFLAAHETSPYANQVRSLLERR